ncbi:MAG: transposase [Candidatus Eisenbacteria bacterium]|nr:transposase [Candidatus Eisenbacteria bacterium]
MAKATRRYSAKLKFQVVLEALRGEKSPGQIAKAYGVHANSIGIWKQKLIEKGPSLFDSARKIAELEQILGKKEVELALLKNFLGRTE